MASEYPHFVLGIVTGLNIVFVRRTNTIFKPVSSGRQASVVGTTELGANNGQKETLQSLSETEGFTDLTISLCSVLLPKGWYRNLKT